MRGRIEIVEHGEPSFAALAREVGAAQAGDALAPVTVVCPSARSAVRFRHRLAWRVRRPGGGRGVANVRFVTLAELMAELAGARARAGGCQPATRVALTAALRAALHEHPGPLARVAAHPSTEAELVDRYLELRQAGDEALERLESRGARGAHVARLCRLARARLAGGWYDDVDLAALAADAVAGTGNVDLGEVVVHLPERMRPSEARFLGTLAAGGPVTVHVGTVGDEAADAPAWRVVSALVDAGFPDPGARPAGAPSDPSRPVGVDELVEAQDPDAEVREATRLVVERLAAGSRAERVAVLYASPSPYARLVASAFEDAGVPWSGPGPDGLEVSPTARALTGLVRLALGWRDRRVLARGEVIDWLRSAPVIEPGGRVAPVGEWDWVSRAAGIVDEGATGWRMRLAGFAARERARREEAIVTDAAPGDAAGERRATAAERARAAGEGLSTFVEALEATCREGCAAGSWPSIAGWAAAALDRFLGAPAARAGGDPQAAAADALVLRVLAELSTLDELDPQPDLAGFAAALDVGLARVGAPAGRFPTGVVVGPLEAVAGLDLDLTIVVGCAEGALPRRPPPSPLLGTADREAAGLDEATSGRVVERDRRRLLVALAGAGRSVATYPRTDGRARRAKVRSRFLGAPGPVYHAPTFAGSLVGVGEGRRAATSPVEVECAALLACADGGGDVERHHLVVGSAELSRGLAVVSARERHQPGRFSGLVGGAAEAQLDLAPFSPTRLEDFATCPFRYFLRHELGCETVEEPERRSEISPLDRGSLVHGVLERFVGELIDRSTAGAPLPAADEAARLRDIALEECGHYEQAGLTGRRALWEVDRRIVLERLESERRRDADRRAAGVVPIGVERAFGDGEQPPVEIAAGTTRLRFRGKIDRIDREPDGSVSVVDYKTGSRRYDSDDPFDRGRHLQLAVYALAAAAAFFGGGDPPAVTARYRLLDQDGDEVPFAFDETSRARLDEVLGTLVSTIASGCYPQHPGPRIWGGFDNCTRCDFRQLCPLDRDRFWERAREVPAIAGYARLAGGEPDDE